MAGRRKKPLSEDDKRLWTLVTKDVAPLPRKRRAKRPPGGDDTVVEEAAPGVAPGPPRSEKPQRLQRLVEHPAGKPIKKASVPPLAPLDKNERRKLSRGKTRVDARIDLHGLRQAAAHDALRGFLIQAHSQGHKMVLVITGKGRIDLSDPLGEDRGVLRRLVPQWLAMADLRLIVVGFEEASRHHGGAGALYVRLRSRTPQKARDLAL